MWDTFFLFNTSYLVDNELYLEMMLFLDINQVGYLSNFIGINSRYQDKMYCPTE